MEKIFECEWSGVKELCDLLDQLPTVALQKSAIRKALLTVGQPVADLAKTLAPFDPYNRSNKHFRDTLKVSTTLKESQRSDSPADRSFVTVFIGSTSPLAHLLEFGTGPRITEKGAWRGMQGPHSFLRTAWDTLRMKILDDLTVLIREEIYTAARKLATKAVRGTLGKAQIRGLMNQ